MLARFLPLHVAYGKEAIIMIPHFLLGILLEGKSKFHSSACTKWQAHVLSNYLGITHTVLLYCPINAENRDDGNPSD